MDNLRTYGSPPFAVAVVHGGPGAAGGMAPVARELSSLRGVLEPLQTATSLEGQVAELRDALASRATLPVTLVGWSWGAWLSLLVAAKHPWLVQKLILVGSAPFVERYAEGIMTTRLARLDVKEREEVRALVASLDNPAAREKDEALARLGDLMARADAYDPLPKSASATVVRYAIYSGVWPAAAELRRSGKLLELAASIQCPVLAVHGDHDPHPAEGVQVPLAAVVRDFEFRLLEGCGHQPWVERRARDRFYEIVRGAL